MKQLLSLFCLLLILSCGSDDGTVNTLTSIEIASSNGERLDIGETTTLSLSGEDQANQPFTITTTITWSSNNGNASVDQNGLVTGLAVGSATITAATEGLQTTFDITIWDSSAPRTEIYVSDAGPGPGSPPYQILKYDVNGENPEVFTNQNLAWPQDILFLEEEGVVLISNTNSNAIGKYNADTGAYLGTFSTALSGPTRMKIGPDGLLYVLQWTGTGHVMRFQLDGTAMGAFTSVGVNQSIGLDWDTAGNLYVSSFNNGANGFVQKFNSQGVDQGLFVSSNLTGPTDIWFDNNGILWVNDWTAGVVSRFNASGISIGNVITGLVNPEGIDYLPNGNLLLGNGGTGAIKMYTPTGNFIKDLVPGRRGGLQFPNAVRVREVN